MDTFEREGDGHTVWRAQEEGFLFFLFSPRGGGYLHVATVLDVDCMSVKDKKTYKMTPWPLFQAHE